MRLCACGADRKCGSAPRSLGPLMTRDPRWATVSLGLQAEGKRLVNMHRSLGHHWSPRTHYMISPPPCTPLLTLCAPSFAYSPLHFETRSASNPSHLTRSFRHSPNLQSMPPVIPSPSNPQSFPRPPAPGTRPICPRHTFNLQPIPPLAPFLCGSCLARRMVTTTSIPWTLPRPNNGLPLPIFF